MANTFALTRCRLSVEASLAKVDANFGNSTYSFTMSSSGFPTFDMTFENGTGNGQANEMYVGRSTVAGTTTVSLDLAGSLVNPVNETITFATIKLILVIIRSPDGTKALRVGPQNVANAFVGPFNAATAYITTSQHAFMFTNYTGWTVTAGSVDIFPIHNPSGTSLDADVLLIGTK